MGEIREQVAYLKGFAEGLNVGESAEGKLIVKMFDVLDSIADAFDDVDDEIEELEEYIEAVDEDLSEMEEIFEDDDCDCGECHPHHHDCDCDDEPEIFEVECPSCGETVNFTSDMIDCDDDVEILCPNCDAVVYTVEHIDGEDLEEDEEEDEE